MGKEADVDQNLLRAFHRGDTKAFRIVFDRFKDPLLYFAQSMLSQKETAEEIVSETFVKLWQRKGDFPDIEKIKAFLYISVRHAALDYLKSNHARQRFQYDVSDNFLMEAPSIYAKLFRAELVAHLALKIDRLPSIQRKIIILSHEEQKNPQEIADQLKLSVNTVYVHYSRAVQALRKAFKANKPNDFLTDI